MLLNEFESARIEADEVFLIPTISLEDIVKNVKEGIKINVNEQELISKYA